MKMREIHELSDDAMKEKIRDLERELAVERGSATAASGKASSPGKIKILRRTIARILTTLRERALQKEKRAGEEKKTAKKTVKKEVIKEEVV